MSCRQRDRRWRLPTAGSIGSALVLALACSGPETPDFFSAPPSAQSGRGGSAGAPPGSGGSGDAAGVGSDGGAPDATGGTGNATGGAGEPSTGGTSDTGGSTSTGGSGADAGTGGSIATGGTGGDSSTGGSGGTGGDSSTGGSGLGGMSGSAGDGTGGLGGSATSGGMGGVGPTAGTTGAGGGGRDPGMGGRPGTAGMGGKSGGCMPTEPETEICDGVDNDCKGGIDDGDVCPSGCVGGVLGKHRYLLCHGDDTYTRQEARAQCNAHGEDLNLTLELVRVESEVESDFLSELITRVDDSHAIWMGASDSTTGGSPGEGSWVWGPADNALLFYEDGEVVGDLFANWGEDQPDDGGSASTEDCAAFEPEFDYRWDDRVCSNETEMYLCEQLDD